MFPFQAVVTEYLIRYCELIFSDKMPVYQSVADAAAGRAGGGASGGGGGNNASNNLNSTSNVSFASTASSVSPAGKKQQLRPKSLAISTPTKLLSLEEAR